LDEGLLEIFNFDVDVSGDLKLVMGVIREKSDDVFDFRLFFKGKVEAEFLCVRIVNKSWRHMYNSIARMETL
jgi:hypothetical protein